MGIVKYKTEAGQEITLTRDTVAKYIADNDQVTEQEFMMFGALCKQYGLNPFIREAYLIKYGDQPATIVTGKDVFTKRAYRNPRFAGCEAGIFVQTANGGYKERPGSMVLPGEQVLGAWAKVYIKSYDVPIYDSVSFEEYAGRKRDGSLTKTWAQRPGTMIRKVALVHALREAFPEEFTGMYDHAEMGVEVPETDTQPPSDAITDEQLADELVDGMEPPNGGEAYDVVYEEGAN